MVVNVGESWVENLRRQKQLMVPIIPAWLPWLAEKCETRSLVPQGGTTGGEHSDCDTSDESGRRCCRRLGDETCICREMLRERSKAMRHDCFCENGPSRVVAFCVHIGSGCKCYIVWCTRHDPRFVSKV